jgi:transposase
MSGQPDKTSGRDGSKPEDRGERGRPPDLSMSPGSVSFSGKFDFEVRSFTNTAAYTVTYAFGGWRCSCPRWEETGLHCKHIERVLCKIDPNRPMEYHKDSLGDRRRAYAQDWAAYDAAQQAEHTMFDALLWDLLEQIPERLRPVANMGRPEIPLRVQLLIAVKKVHLGKSSRRARGLMQTQYGGGKGILGRVPSYAVPTRLFRQDGVTAILLQLIRLSSLPLAALEAGKTVAIDSTGFCTTCRGSYCTEKHDPSRKHRWIKAHLAVGTRTHAVLSVTVTDEHGGDSPQFIPLLKQVVDSGFTPERVTADKAYLSKDNLEAAEELGIDPYIPYKSNSVGKSRSSPIWRRKYFEFQAKRDEFDSKYHARSNVEAVISAVKRKLGEEIHARLPTARFNELLAKILAYNIGVLIHQIYENGIDPGVPGVPAVKRPPKPRDSPAMAGAS